MVPLRTGIKRLGCGDCRNNFSPLATDRRSLGAFINISRYLNKSAANDQLAVASRIKLLTRRENVKDRRQMVFYFFQWTIHAATSDGTG